ncbi:hypothetical protein LEN26_019088 [Aphanomyces euteiches]|nr:hypothetical protein LEN26_019088 [Aphanomyces euteiches]KAH9106405.1 hypothetical protein AeMF1_017987 [Aphanomyces euteiches]
MRKFATVLSVLAAFASAGTTSSNDNGCLCYALPQQFDAILEFNRTSKHMQVVDRNCNILNTTNYNALGNLQSTIDYEDGPTFGDRPVLSLEEAVFLDITTYLEIRNTTIKAFPQQWPSKLTTL